MSNRWVISWLVIDYWRWSMSNRWVIEAQKFCGLSITHRWHRLLIDVIDNSSMTHRLLIDYYTAHERHFSCFLVPFFSFVILLSVLDAFFLVSEDPEDPALQEKGNELLHQPQIGGRNFRICRKWPLRPCTKTASIHRTELLKNLQNWTTLTGQPSRYGSTTNGKEILENLLNLNFHVLLKLKRINLETSVYI